MIYKIKNPFGPPTYVVPNGTTFMEEAQDYVFFGGEELAKEKLSQMRQFVLEQESYRFVAAKIVINGNDTTWMSADFEQEDGDGDYRVFDHSIGGYEEYSSTQAAKARLEELKLEFLTSVGLDSFETFDKLPSSLLQPTVFGAQEL